MQSQQSLICTKANSNLYSLPSLARVEPPSSLFCPNAGQIPFRMEDSPLLVFMVLSRPRQQAASSLPLLPLQQTGTGRRLACIVFEPSLPLCPPFTPFASAKRRSIPAGPLANRESWEAMLSNAVNEFVVPPIC